MRFCYKHSLLRKLICALCALLFLLGSSACSVFLNGGANGSLSSIESATQSETSGQNGTTVESVSVPTSLSELPATSDPGSDIPTDVTPSSFETPETPTDPETPTEPETPTVPEPPVDESEYVGEYGENGVKRIALKDQRPMNGILLLGKHLVTLGRTEDEAFIAVYDLTTGEEVCFHGGITDGYGDLIAVDRGGYAYTTALGLFLYFDSPTDPEPEVLHEEDITYEELEFGNASSYRFYGDGSRLQVKRGSDDAADVIDYGNVFTDEQKDVAVPFRFSYMLFRGLKDGVVTIYSEYYEDDAETIRSFDLNTGTVVSENDAGSFTINYYDGFTVDTSRNGFLIIRDFNTPEEPHEITLFRRNEYINSLDPKSGTILTVFSKSGSATTVTVYDLQGTPIFREGLFDGNSYICSSVFTENGVLLLITRYDPDTYVETDTILFIDFRLTGHIDPPKFDERTAALINELESMYPLTVLIGEDAILDFPDFSATPCVDEVMNYEALELLKDFLASFPEGFINEMFTETENGNPTHLTVCFTGALRPESEYGISNPAAYAYYTWSEQYLVLDLYQNNYLRENLAHEMMHAIDRRLDAVADYNAYPDWYKFVPDMSVYNYGYKGNDGYDYYNGRYTIGSEDTAWFIDSYSKTFPTEDRARLFENMFTGNQYSNWLAYPRITARMTYLAKVIRDNFKCMENCEQAIWERLI